MKKIVFLILAFLFVLPPLLSAQETGGVLFEDLEALYNQTNGFQDNFTLPVPSPTVNETTNETTYPLVLTGPFYTDLQQVMTMCDVSQDFTTYQGRLAFNLTNCLARNIQTEKDSYNASLTYLKNENDGLQKTVLDLKQVSNESLAKVIGGFGSNIAWGVVGLITLGVAIYAYKRNPGKIKQWTDASIHLKPKQEEVVQEKKGLIPVSRTNKYGGARDRF